MQSLVEVYFFEQRHCVPGFAVARCTVTFSHHKVLTFQANVIASQLSTSTAHWCNAHGDAALVPYGIVDYSRGTNMISYCIYFVTRRLKFGPATPPS